MALGEVGDESASRLCEYDGTTQSLHEEIPIKREKTSPELEKGMNENIRTPQN